MKLLLLSLPFLLSGCITLGYQGWIAQHSLEISQVALVAGAVSQVEGVIINTNEIVKEAKKP